MKLLKPICAVLVTFLLFCGCTAAPETSDVIAATTYPVYQFASAVCAGTELSVKQVVTGQISCLHDYTLTVRQMQIIEDADLILMSGGALEEFMHDAIAGHDNVIECSNGIRFLENDEGIDPHIWLDPDNAAVMTQNIADALSERYPQYEAVFHDNADAFIAKLSELSRYGTEMLSDLSRRDLITFHDGFAYFADAFDLNILASLEEEDGAMASASTLEEIILLVRENRIPAIFIELNGSDSAATVIRAETGAKVFTLSMAMSGEDYLTAMRNNINTIKEALQ